MALTNEIRLIGHCADIPTEMMTKLRKRMARVAVYTKNWWTDQHGEIQEQQECHVCLFFGRNADKALKFLLKGTQIHLRGSMHYEIRTKEKSVKTVYAQVRVEEFTLSDQVLMSKDAYERIFAGETPQRKALHPRSEESHEFDGGLLGEGLF